VPAAVNPESSRITPLQQFAVRRRVSFPRLVPEG